MVVKDIIKEANKIEKLEDRKKFLLKALKKVKDKDDQLEIKRVLDEIKKKEEHIPVEGQDLSRIPQRTIDVGETPKYERLEQRALRGQNELESKLEGAEPRREEKIISYGQTDQNNKITSYQGATPQELRSSLDTIWAQEGIDKRAIDSDPGIRARARELANQYSTSSPENIETYISAQDQRFQNETSNKFYESKPLLRETNIRESIEIDRKKKKQREEDIDKYFVRPKGDSF